MQKYLNTKVDYLSKELPCDIMQLHGKYKHLFYLDAITKEAIKEIKPDYIGEEFKNLQSWLYMAGHIQNKMDKKNEEAMLLKEGWSKLTPEYIREHNGKMIIVKGKEHIDMMTRTFNNEVFKCFCGHEPDDTFIMKPRARTRGRRISRREDELYAKEK